MVLTDAGEDVVAVSEDGSYAANIERATRTIPPLAADPSANEMQALEKVHTPNCASIEDVCAFLKVQPSQMVKTLVYQVGDEKKPSYVIACVRGDHEVNENKLRRLCRERGLGEPRMAQANLATEFSIGYVGPHAANGLKYPLIIDSDVRAIRNAVTGANEPGYHVKGFNWARDLKTEVLQGAIVADVRNVVEGDIAPNDGAKLSFRKAIEIGHVFKLGTKYSDSMGATFLDEQGKPKSLIMGCYGIGVNRILAAAIEAHHDADGIRWPVNIPPFQVLIVALDINDETVMSTARGLHDSLEAKGLDVLLDDRDQRAGFKFKDADLIGIPVRITVGKKTLAEGLVELKMRGDAAVEKVSPEAAIAEAIGRTTG